MVSPWQLLAIAHMIIIGPLLVALGFEGRRLPQAAFPAIAVIGVAIGFYHGYRYLSSGFRPINLFHLLVVAPVITYIGIRGRRNAGFAFNIAAMLGFAAIGYNGMNLALHS